MKAGSRPAWIGYLAGCAVFVAGLGLAAGLAAALMSAGLIAAVSCLLLVPVDAPHESDESGPPGRPSVKGRRR